MKASARHDDSDPTPRTPRGPFERIRGLSTRTRWTGVAVLVLIVAFGAWLGVGAYQAKSNLEQARDSAERSKEALLSGKPEDAVRSAEIAQLHANQARAATHSLPWNLAAAIPLLGSPLKATQQISDVVVGLADKVLLPTAAMGGTVTPDQLISGTHLNLGLLRAEQPRLSELSSAATKLDEQARTPKKSATPIAQAPRRRKRSNDASRTPEKRPCCARYAYGDSELTATFLRNGSPSCATAA